MSFSRSTKSDSRVVLRLFGRNGIYTQRGDEEDYLFMNIYTMTKNILTLESQEAMDFFMKSEHYHGFELPEYFTFDKVLEHVR